MRKKLITIAMTIALVAVICATLVSCGVAPNKNVETITIGDGSTLKIGVFSDSQLNQSNTYESKYAGHLRETLTLFKQQKVDLILFAGDICDLVSDEAYQTHNRIWDEVFGNNAPEKLYIMGNHDYWYENDYNSTAGKQKKFEKYIGQSPWEHKVINGFHFIACSPSKGSGLEEKELDWLKEQLVSATENNKDKPVFVLTHHNVPDTVYGSNDWSDSALKGVFDNYSNVVSISGHSHNALLDERSIFQDKFTAIQTQSIAYLEQGGDYGKYVPSRDKISTVPDRDDEAPMCYIINVDQNKTVVERWNVMMKVEEKADMRWELKYPLTPTSFKYKRDLVEPSRTAPEFEDGATVLTEQIKNEMTDNIGLVFAPAKHEDCVYAYIVKLEDVNTGAIYTYRYFSDYYLGKSAATGNVRLALPSELPSGRYTASVWAQESFGRFSQSCITTENDFDYTHKAPLK